MKRPHLTRGLLAGLLITTSLAAIQGSSVHRQQAASGNGKLLDDIINRGELRVGMTLQFKPEMYLDDAGKPAGYDVDVLNMLATDLGVKLKIENQEFDALIPGLLTNKWDMISVGLVPRPARLKQMYFTDPYVPYEQVLAVPSGKATGTTIADYDKAGFTITALQGSSAAEKVKSAFPNASLKEFPQQDAALLEVASGRAGGILVERYIAAQFQASNPGKLDIVAFDQPLSLEYGSWAIPRGETDFLTYLNSWLRYYKNNGTLDKMYNDTIAPVGAIWPRG